MLFILPKAAIYARCCKGDVVVACIINSNLLSDEPQQPKLSKSKNKSIKTLKNITLSEEQQILLTI